MKKSTLKRPAQVRAWQGRVWFRMGSVLMTMGFLAMAGSCRMLSWHEPAQKGPPAWVYPVRHFAGSAVSGPTDVNLGPVGAADVCEVTVTWVALQRPAGLHFEPLDRYARLIVSLPADQAIRPVGHLTQEIRVLPNRDPNSLLAELTSGTLGTAMILDNAQGVVPRGATVSLGVSDRNDSDADQPPYVEVLVSRPDDGPQRIELAVAMTDYVRIMPAGQGRQSGKPSDSSGVSAEAEPAVGWVRETVEMSPVTVDGSLGSPWSYPASWTVRGCGPSAPSSRSGIRVKARNWPQPWTGAVATFGRSMVRALPIQGNCDWRRPSWPWSNRSTGRRSF